MASQRDKGHAVNQCQSQDQNQGHGVLDEAIFNFFYQLIECKGQCGTVCQIWKRALVCFTNLLIVVLMREFSLMSHVHSLMVGDRGKIYKIYKMFSLVLRMLQFQDTCQSVESTRCQCLYSPAICSENQLTLQFLMASVAMVRGSVSFLCEIPLRPFGLTPYVIMDTVLPNFQASHCLVASPALCQAVRLPSLAKPGHLKTLKTLKLQHRIYRKPQVDQGTLIFLEGKPKSQTP